jgi:hypothetical protein
MVAIDPFFEELCPLRDFRVFRTFFSLLKDIHLIFGTLLCHTKIQIKFEIGFDPFICPKVTVLGLRYHELSVFRTFFSLLTDIHLQFDTLLSNTKLQIRFESGFHSLIFHEVMALGLRKISRIISFQHFFLSAHRYGTCTLLCHTKLHIKCEFGSIH